MDREPATLSGAAQTGTSPVPVGSPPRRERQACLVAPVRGVGAGGGIEPTGAAGNGTSRYGWRYGWTHTGSAGTGRGTPASEAPRARDAAAPRAGGLGGAGGKGAAGASGSSGRGGSGGSGGAAGHGGAAGGSAGSGGKAGSGNEVGLPTPYLRYTFDQTSGTKITDVTGHSHDATVVGTAVGFGNGIMGNDLSLNGTTGNYVSLPTGVVQSLTDVTIAFWVLIHSDTTADRWQRVFDFGSNTNQNMYFVPHSSVGHRSVRDHHGRRVGGAAADSPGLCR